MEAFGILVERAEEMARGFIEMLPQIAIASFTLLLTWGASALARSAANGIISRVGLRHRLRRLAVSFSGLLTWTCGILVALAVVVPGVEAGGLLAALAIASVAAAYIFDDLFQNFLAGVMMMLRKKLRIGDFIECEDIKGRVEQITARETYLRKLSNELVLVPNAFLFQNGVEIVTDHR